MKKPEPVEVEKYEYPVDPGTPLSYWADFLALEVAGGSGSQHASKNRPGSSLAESSTPPTTRL